MCMQAEDTMMRVLDDFKRDQADASTCGCCWHYIVCLSTHIGPNCVLHHCLLGAFLCIEYFTMRNDAGLINQILRFWPCHSRIQFGSLNAYFLFGRSARWNKHVALIRQWGLRSNGIGCLLIFFHLSMFHGRIHACIYIMVSSHIVPRFLPSRPSPMLSIFLCVESHAIHFWGKTPTLVVCICPPSTLVVLAAHPSTMMFYFFM